MKFSVKNARKRIIRETIVPGVEAGITGSNRIILITPLVIILGQLAEVCGRGWFLRECGAGEKNQKST
jgi:hypothetical protein